LGTTGRQPGTTKRLKGGAAVAEKYDAFDLLDPKKQKNNGRKKKKKGKEIGGEVNE